MSALTKLFVVLLIICALLLSAGVVVFVNQTDNYKVAWNASQTALNLAQKEKVDAVTDAANARLSESNTANQMNAKFADLNRQLADLKASLDDANKQVGSAKTHAAIDQANITQQATALAIAADNIKSVTTRNDGLVKENDKLRLNNAELASDNTDYAKQLDSVTRALRFEKEQNIQARADVARLTKVINEKGLTIESNPAPVRSAPDIKGRIKEVKHEDGQTYATITVGTVDKVEKGMQFNVIDEATTQFLGKLTVDVVEPNEAFGRIEGPHVEQVQKDQEVRTQL